MSERDLLLEWFKDIGSRQEMHLEPILDINAVKFYKQVCDAFEQNTHVFILSIEIAEAYLRAKNARNEKIADPLLAAVTTAFISHKCEGAPESLKVKHVIDILFFFTHEWYTPDRILTMEQGILEALDGKIPITTTLDDLDIVIERYVSTTRLRADIRPLCLSILEYFYMERQNIFSDVREIYNQNQDCRTVFGNLISSKLYVPISILLAALQLTQYRNILDIEKMLTEVTEHTKIHGDHVSILAAKIMDIVNI